MQTLIQRTKVVNGIRKAISIGGPDPSVNAWLERLLVDARHIQIPKHVIDAVFMRTIKRLDPQLAKTQFYEGRLGSYFLYVECRTMDAKVTQDRVRSVFERFGCRFYDQPGNVSWMFKRHGMVEYYAPLTMREIDRVAEQVQSLITDCHTNYNRQTVLIPEAIPFKELLNGGVECAADDVNIINIPADQVLLASDIPFHLVPRHLKRQIPQVQGVQALINPKYHLLLHEDLSAWMYRGTRSFIHRSGEICIPDLSEYSSDAIWQEIIESETSTSAEISPVNSEMCRNVLELIEQIKDNNHPDNIDVKGISEVVEVWHNIRGLAPWNDYVFESQLKAQKERLP